MNTAPRPIRLLMLSHYFEERRGGIEFVAAALARQLAEQGFSLVWLATGEARSGAEDSSCRRSALAASSVAERFLHVPYPLLLPSAWRAIFREAARSDVILVHDALYMTSLIAFAAARVHRKPLVIIQHIGLVPYRNGVLRRLMQGANRCVAAPLLRGADRVVFISQLTQQYFAQIRWRRAPALVFSGVDTRVFSPAFGDAAVESARTNLGLPVDAPIALFVGRFVEKKGLRVLEILARMRPDVLFTFAGDGPLDPRRWALPNVRVYRGLSGSTLAPLYRASDVLLLPSAGEGFPLVVQEALASGLMVVCGADTARADPGATRLLNSIEVDLAKPDETAGRLSEALTHVLAQPLSESEQRVRLEFARESYSWAMSAAKYAAILRELRARAA